MRPRRGTSRLEVRRLKVSPVRVRWEHGLTDAWVKGLDNSRSLV
jgi:hypothetical protein